MKKIYTGKAFRPSQAKEEALDLEKNGFEISGIPKLQAEHLESMLESALPVLGQAFSRTGWRLVGEHLRRQERKCRIPYLEERIKAARIMARYMPATAQVMDALTAMEEMERLGGVKMCDGLARRMLREAAYAVMNKEFGGRQVG